MAHPLGREPVAVLEFGTRPAVSRRSLGQRSRGIEACECVGHGLQRGDVSGALLTQRHEQLLLARLQLVLGAEHLGFACFEVGRDVTLGVRQRLTALIVRWHLVAVRVRDLEVEAEHLVVANLEARDTRAHALADLQVRDPLLARVRQFVQRVTHGVEAAADDAAITRRDRRFIGERALQLLQQCGRDDEQPRLERECAGRQRGRQSWQPLQRVANRTHVTRRRLGTRDTGGEALEVGQAAQRVTEPETWRGGREPRGDRLLTGGDRGERGERTLEPGPEPAPAGRRDGDIHVRPQRVRHLATGLRREQLQVAGGGRVVTQDAVFTPALDARHLSRDTALRAIEVIECRRRSRERERQVGVGVCDPFAPTRRWPRGVQIARDRHPAARAAESRECRVQPWRDRFLDRFRHQPLGDPRAREQRRGFGPVALGQLHLAGRSVG